MEFKPKGYDLKDCKIIVQMVSPKKAFLNILLPDGSKWVTIDADAVSDCSVQTNGDKKA